LVNVSNEGEKLDQGDNLVMWAEAPFTTPSALVLDPRFRWEPIDVHAARLVFPLRGSEESLQVEFDPETGLMRTVSGMRYRDEEKTKTPYRGEYSEWSIVRGIKVPSHPEAMWEDQREPYVTLDIDGAEYNVDVSDKIPSMRLDP
jgi:hypothetical protein